MESSKSDLELLVKNQLKGQKIAKMITDNNLNAVAQQFNVKVDSVYQITYDSKFINNLGQNLKY
ncbi:MAG: hypothetical protein R2771_01510 [Saprospiraceae bacterium]